MRRMIFRYVGGTCPLAGDLLLFADGDLVTTAAEFKGRGQTEDSGTYDCYLHRSSSVSAASSSPLMSVVSTSRIA